MKKFDMEDYETVFAVANLFAETETNMGWFCHGVAVGLGLAIGEKLSKSSYLLKSKESFARVCHLTETVLDAMDALKREEAVFITSGHEGFFKNRRLAGKICSIVEKKKKAELGGKDGSEE